MEELLKLIVDSIIGPENKISKTQQDNQLVFTIMVPQDKIGWVIGKEGKIVKAIKTLMGVKAINEKATSWRLEVATLEEK